MMKKDEGSGEWLGAEGVSLNQLVTAYISEGLGRHSAV